MTPESDDAAWTNEYELWASEQEEAEKLDRLNAILRAARDGTIFDTRTDDERRD